MKQIYRSLLLLVAAMLTGLTAMAQTEKDLDLSTLNSSLIGDGTYTADHQLTTGQYGLAGWNYGDAGIDLSGYDKLVVELSEAPGYGGGSQLRIFDTNNGYADNHYRISLDGQTKVEVELSAMTNNDDNGDGAKLDLANINIIGFWSYGNESSAIKLQRVYLVKTVPENGIASDLFDWATFNHKIWDPDNKASLDATTGAFTVAQYCFGGWEWSTPVDLSEYKALVVEFAQPTAIGIQVRLYDQNNYWDNGAAHNEDEVQKGSTTAVLDLSALKHKSDDSSLDLSTIYKLGIWAWDEGTVTIQKIYLVKDFTVTLNASGLATFSSAIPVRVTGATAYTAKISGSNVNCTPVADGKVPAYTGVILKGEAGANVTLTFDNTAESLSNNDLVATTTADGTSALTSAYVLSADAFVTFNGTAFTADKAYLPASVGAKSLNIVFGGTTAINSVQAETTANDAVYNLAGQRVEADYKGIVIKNGKKYINK